VTSNVNALSQQFMTFFSIKNVLKLKEEKICEVT